MERSIIESMVASLPFSEMGQISKDNETWEEIDGEANFAVTRHILTSAIDGSRHIVIALSVFGEPSERRRIINEFVEIYGEGSDSELSAGEGDPDTVLWVVNN